MTTPARTPRLGVCSWSLRPEGPSELAAAAARTGVDALQIALGPLRTRPWPRDRGAWPVGGTVAALADVGVAVRSGMVHMTGEDYTTLETIRATGGVRPDATWVSNLAAARRQAPVARRLGIDLVTFHGGFLPEQRDDPERAHILERLAALVDIWADAGVRVGFETGQETAATLEGVLQELDRPTAGVNFDPANMLLYDMGDPVEALDRLAPFVHQIHVKDARRTDVAGTWGTEVPVGEGEVDWPAFFDVVKRRELRVDLMIEREAGEQRIADVQLAAERVREWWPW